jgi:hypothetical protein
MWRLKAVLSRLGVLLLATSVLGACQSTGANGEVQPVFNTVETQRVTWADLARAQNARRIDCIREIGDWDESLVWADYYPISIVISTPGGQEDVHDEIVEAHNVCGDIYPDIPRDVHPVSLTQAEAFYQALIAGGQCLSDLGFSVSEPPSMQELIDDILDLPWGIWHPWADLFWGDSPATGLLLAFEKCPVPNLLDFWY